MHILIKKVRELYKSGFFDIIGATVINSLISFVYGVFIIRVLSKTDYGTFSYVQNILNFGFLFCSLGGGVGLLQFCTSKIDDKQKYGYCKLALTMGVIGSIAVPVIMVLYTEIDQSGMDNLMTYMLECSLLPALFFLKDWTTANLRWQFKNREYGIVMNVHSLLNALLAVVGAIIWGIQGVIIGIYLAYAGAGICALYFLKDTTISGMSQCTKPDRSHRVDFFKYSMTMCVVNALVSVLFTIDLFIIGNIVKNSEQIAMYKAASTIPYALNMVPNSIMVFVYPHVVQHKNDSEWMGKNIRLLYLANMAINCFIGIVLLIGAPLITSILFGSAYEGITPIFRILVVSYIVNSCLRTPSTNLLGALKMSRVALGVSAFTVAISAVLGIIFVNRYGIIGAAYGSVLTFLAVGLISFSIIMYVVYIRKSDLKEETGC